MAKLAGNIKLMSRDQIAKSGDGICRHLDGPTFRNHIQEAQFIGETFARVHVYKDKVQMKQTETQDSCNNSYTKIYCPDMS